MACLGRACGGDGAEPTATSMRSLATISRLRMTFFSIFTSCDSFLARSGLKAPAALRRRACPGHRVSAVARAWAVCGTHRSLRAQRGGRTWSRTAGAAGFCRCAVSIRIIETDGGPGRTDLDLRRSGRPRLAHGISAVHSACFLRGRECGRTLGFKQDGQGPTIAFSQGAGERERQAAGGRGRCRERPRRTKTRG